MATAASHTGNAPFGDETPRTRYAPTTVVAATQGCSATTAAALDSLEQRFLALVDLGRVDDARETLVAINQRVGGPKQSLRARVLSGILAEARGRFQDALEIYHVVLDEDECHASAYKRCVAVHKRLGDRAAAIRLLLVYLDAGFHTDVEAWVELAQLYTDQGSIAHALHCYEEVIVLQPDKYLYQLQYADLLYAAGNFELAKKYYCAVLIAANNKPRALLGLRMCLSQLETTAAVKSDTDKDLVNLVEVGIKSQLLDPESLEAQVLTTWLEELSA